MSARLIMKLEVTDLAHEAGDVAVVSLKHPRRPALPVATAGAHVDVHVPDLGVRQYSLCGDPADCSRYRIAVKREADGRGGSRWLHENLKVGAVLNVSAPRNHFELEEAERYLLLAGGIGLTPMLAMAHALRAEGRPVVLHAFARSRSAVPLLAEIEKAAGADRLSLHLSDEPESRIALADLLAVPQPGSLIYCCGSPRFMDGVREAAAAWPEDSVRFEAFAPLLDTDFVPEPFEIAVPSREAIPPVPAGRSALDVLRELGIELPSSCEMASAEVANAASWTGGRSIATSSCRRARDGPASFPASRGPRAPSCSTCRFI